MKEGIIHKEAMKTGEEGTYTTETQRHGGNQAKDRKLRREFRELPRIECRKHEPARTERPALPLTLEWNQAGVACSTCLTAASNMVTKVGTTGRRASMP